MVRELGVIAAAGVVEGRDGVGAEVLFDVVGVLGHEGDGEVGGLGGGEGGLIIHATYYKEGEAGVFDAYNLNI